MFCVFALHSQKSKKEKLKYSFDITSCKAVWLSIPPVYGFVCSMQGATWSRLSFICLSFTEKKENYNHASAQSIKKTSNL